MKTREHPVAIRHSNPALLFLGIAALSSVAWADSPLLTVTGNTTSVTARADNPFTIGSLFQVGSTPLFVTHLGAMDVDAPIASLDTNGNDGNLLIAQNDGFYSDTFGFGQAIQVGLWTTGGTLLASANVYSTNPYQGGWRYADVSAQNLTLQPNTQYLVGAVVGTGLEWFLDAGTSANATVAEADSALFTLMGARYFAGAGLNAPTVSDGGAAGRWGAGNLIVTPEPSTALLATAGLALVALRRRRA